MTENLFARLRCRLTHRLRISPECDLHGTEQSSIVRPHYRTRSHRVLAPPRQERPTGRLSTGPYVRVRTVPLSGRIVRFSAMERGSILHHGEVVMHTDGITQREYDPFYCLIICSILSFDSIPIRDVQSKEKRESGAHATSRRR